MSASTLGRGTGKTFLKLLHRRRCVWKASHTKKLPDRYLPTGSDIDEPADMFEFFKYCELDCVTPYTEDFLGSILDGDGNIRLVDTEFAGQFLVQISIRNARGELLFRRTVDHGMTVQELYERATQFDGPIDIVFGVLNKFYGPPNQKSTRDCRNASTLVNIFKEIAQKNALQPQHKLFEWSYSRCDYHYTYAAAEKVGYTHLMPPCGNSVLCIRPLRKAMPGLFSFSLPMLFYLIDPKSRLAFDAYDSGVDTLMLFIVLVIFALKISGREDEFLSWWERDQDLPEGWTAGFIADWMKKPIQAQPGISPLNLPAASSRKRTLESAGNSTASKKAKFQSDKSKPQPKKAGTQPGKSKTPTTKSVSRRRPRKSPPNSLTNQKKQGQIVVQDPSPDQQEASLPTARQSSRTKGKLPQYREESDGDDSDGSVFTGDEADDEST